MSDKQKRAGGVMGERDHKPDDGYVEVGTYDPADGPDFTENPTPAPAAERFEVLDYTLFEGRIVLRDGTTLYMDRVVSMYNRAVARIAALEVERFEEWPSTALLLPITEELLGKHNRAVAQLVGALERTKRLESGLRKRQAARIAALEQNLSGALNHSADQNYHRRQLVKQIDALERENKALLALATYGRKMFDEARSDGGNDVDGAAAEQHARDCGLLHEVPVSEPCGENCRCAEYYWADEWPNTCLRETDKAQLP